MNVTKAQSVLVGLLVLASGVLVIALSDVALRQRAPATPVVQLSPAQMLEAALRAELSGAWVSAANDFEDVQFDFDPSGVFFLRSQFVGHAAVYTGSGQWRVEVGSLDDVLMLTFDSPVTIPENEQVAAQYAGWGQFFKNEREVGVILERDSAGILYFRWDGVLVLRDQSAESEPVKPL